MQENKLIKYTSNVIHVGSVPLGGDYPIRLQSMTNTDTLNTKASVAQCIRIIEEGADFVRLTAQGIKEAENLAEIKKELRLAGFNTPLIADIHFNPAAAEIAARLVEKVRINPGNYVDKRASFDFINITEKQYDEELERIHYRLLPLINICREYKTVIRVGINHGSLSDRIMSRYGNTPEGMVHSALEFISIFRSENFNDLVLSMKSSDTAIMIESTRMLVKKMQKEGIAYPLHLGVTEAGEGEDGRIRSAAGIGALLAEGIGDTIRVSLSEDPEMEIPVAKKLVGFYSKEVSKFFPEKSRNIKSLFPKPELFKTVKGPLVISDMTEYHEVNNLLYLNAGYSVDTLSGEATKTDGSADAIILGQCPEKIPGNIILSAPYKCWIENYKGKNFFPLFTFEAYMSSGTKSDKFNIMIIDDVSNDDVLKKIDTDTFLILLRFYPEEERYAADHFLHEMNIHNQKLNVILNPVFSENNLEDLLLKASSLLGRYIINKSISGICITNIGNIESSELTKLSFSILQCTGTRITRTMYVSCPTCGRTRFNLPDAVKKVKAATSHLKGLKIAVMGCIVNGPGEMAGADYGYVGAAAGKVHIYKGTVPVIKNVPEANAVEELLKLIEKDLENPVSG